MTLKPAADVRKDTDNSRYLFERVEKAGIPGLISRASNNGEYKVKFDYAKLNWDGTSSRVSSVFSVISAMPLTTPRRSQPSRCRGKPTTKGRRRRKNISKLQ